MIAAIAQTDAVESTGAGLTVASLENVNKNYGNLRALRNVDFRVRAGEVVALLGPNGAGKTTAVKLLLGLMTANSGRVRVFGGDPTNPENRMRTGAMLQVGRVPETLRVREHIDLFSTYYQRPMAPAEVLATVAVTGADRRSGRMTPSTPAPSAVRRRAPRLWGSSTLSRARKNRWCPGSPGASKSSIPRNLRSRTTASTP